MALFRVCHSMYVQVHICCQTPADSAFKRGPETSVQYNKYANALRQIRIQKGHLGTPLKCE
jgi:hypothetical protein